MAVGKFCGQCGAAIGKDTVVSGLSAGLFGPVVDYFRFMPTAMNPVMLVAEVKERRFTFSRAIAFAASAIFLATIVEYFFPSESNPLNPTFPGLSEAIVLAALVTLLALTGWPLHLLLNIGKKGVSFGQFMIVNIALTAIFYPWLTLFYGILATYANITDGAERVLYGVVFLYIQAWKLLYDRSLWSTFGYYLLYVVLFSIVVSGFILAMG
ncbi:hypothetical protein [Brevundimonas sp.]|uniref:hypothetical protein n=1 Tax=Brevundimonas sp. TaxID=1871086 RepID=UPI00262BF0E6|nr:hypothetical protein [Brevundimonas sp.]